MFLFSHFAVKPALATKQKKHLAQGGEGSFILRHHAKKFNPDNHLTKRIL